jgi:nitrite reductase/ring-hydroxylating ferredoxin subunit/uncharacterized membrane protein
MQRSPANLSDALEQAVTSVPGLDRLGKFLWEEIHALTNSSEGARRLADLLHGTWMGHPLHPVLTDLVVGSWSIAALFDALSLVGGAEMDDAADALVGLGILAALPTALTGLVDYGSMDQDALPTATAHAIANDLGLACYVTSWWARRNGRRGLGMALSMTGFAVMTAAASLGGSLVFRQKVGVNHAPAAENSEEWAAVLPESELPANQMKSVELDDNPVLLYRQGGQIYAISAVCSHAGGPLQEGSVQDGCVECPWHQSVFDLRDGHVVHGPATMPQPRYETRVRSGQIELRPVAALSLTD